MRNFENLPQSFQTKAVKEYYDILSHKKVSLFFKRLLDFLVSFILLVLFCWVFVIIALAVKCTSKGEINF